VKYAVNLDRAHSQYDIIDSEFLEDLKKMNLYYTRYINEKVTLSLKVENAFDDVVEVVPFYDNQGTEFYLTLGYNW
jgi:outer membrane cobalamin receptor